MTLEQLSEKMDSRFDRMDGKLDSVCTTVAVHTNTLNGHRDDITKIDTRLSKVEKVIWFALGGSGAAGFGLAKLFGVGS